MHDFSKKVIEDSYGIKIEAFSEAPRQFVGETFFIETSTGKKYFAKIIDKKLFIPEVTAGLPILEKLSQSGIPEIPYPIRTISNQLSIFDGANLLVLFNLIQAQQSYDYNEAALGRLLGRIHKSSEHLDLSLAPRETFVFPYHEIFEFQFEGLLSGKLVKDRILQEMQSLLKNHETKIRIQYKSLAEFAERAKNKAAQFVITHGDSVGNVLVESRDKVHLVDWDNILLAPAQRDTWVLEDISNFLEGYKEIYPDYKSDYDITIYYTLKYYFSSMVHRFTEILSNKPEKYRETQFNKFIDNLLEGWMVPYLKKANLY